MVSPTPPTVVVRTKNSAGTLQAAFASLREQTVPVRIVVVDSGSTDDTLSIAADTADLVVTLPSERFTHGRALNIGIARSEGEVTFALSSHVRAPTPDWVERSLRHHADPSVIAACGLQMDALDQPLTTVVRQDLAMARAHPHWGLTNTAVSWRTVLVREFPFDEDLEACEDKEWPLRVLAARSGVVVVDPSLAVTGAHRMAAGRRAYFERVRRERRALLRIGALPRRGAREIAVEWFHESRRLRPTRRGFSSVTRVIDASAEYVAQRDLRR